MSCIPPNQLSGIKRNKMSLQDMSCCVQTKQYVTLWKLEAKQEGEEADGQRYFAEALRSHCFHVFVCPYSGTFKGDFKLSLNGFSSFSILWLSLSGLSTSKPFTLLNIKMLRWVNMNLILFESSSADYLPNMNKL